VKKRVVRNSANYDYKFGERQYEYMKGQFLFREPLTNGMRWDLNTRNSLIRLLKATQRTEAWEFCLKEQFGRAWYIVRVYHPNRRDQPLIVMDSDSLNVFVAQCCFYCVRFRHKLLDSVYGDVGMDTGSKMDLEEDKIERGKHEVHFENDRFLCKQCKWASLKLEEANKHATNTQFEKIHSNGKSDPVRTGSTGTKSKGVKASK
jgi:hypothetical protein